MTLKPRLNLESRLRALAAAGELTYLSVVPVAGKGGIVFSATFSSATKWGHTFGRDADPVEAIHKAIDDHGVRLKVPPADKTLKEPVRPPLEIEADPWLAEPADLNGLRA